MGAALFLFFLFCSFFFCFKNNLSEPAKGCGTWEPGPAGEETCWHQNSKLHPQSSGLQFPVTLPPVSTLGWTPLAVSFPSVFRCSPALSAGWTPLHLSSPLHSCFTHFHTFRPNGFRPKRIMPQEPHEAPNLQLFLRQIFLGLKTSKFCHYPAESPWADLIF